MVIVVVNKPRNMILVIDTELNKGRLTSKTTPTVADYAKLERAVKSLVSEALSRQTSVSAPLDITAKPLPINS